MARNRIQFQKGLSEAHFVTLYGNEERCREAVARWRWPDGFRCPKCGGGEHCMVGPRALYQCNACRRQTSLTAGTIFAATKVPLTTWFRAMYLITQTKQGISSIELGRRLGVTQTTAWKIKTKLAEVMRIAGEKERLEGRIEMDDAYLGGERGGGKTGRGTPGKKPIVVAVQTTDEGRPRRIKLRRIARFKRRRVKSLAKRIIAPGATVVTDGLGCFRGVADAGCTHVAIAAGSGRKAARHPAFKWVNDARQHQVLASRNLPRLPQEAPGPLSRRVRMALQQPLRSRSHDPRTRPRCRLNETRAILVSQDG